MSLKTLNELEILTKEDAGVTKIPKEGYYFIYYLTFHLKSTMNLNNFHTKIIPSPPPLSKCLAFLLFFLCSVSLKLLY